MPAATAEPKADPGAELLKKYEMAEDVPEPETDPEPEPAKPAETPKPVLSHPSWLTRAAKKAGFEESDLAELSTDDLKEALVVRGQERAATNQANAVDVAINAAGRPYDPATGQLLPAGTPTAQPVADKPFSLKDSLGVDPTTWKEDATTEEILTSVVKPLMDRIAKLESGLTEFDRREQGRQAASTYDRLDQLFAEDADRFGKGTRHRLKPGPELAKRKAVISRMSELHKEVPGISFEDSFEQASTELFGVKAAPAPKEDPNVLKFAEASTLRPAQRNGVKTAKGRSAAEANVASILKERASSDPTTEHDELPD